LTKSSYIFFSRSGSGESITWTRPTSDGQVMDSQ
jgi:hypothetical protein